MNRHSVRLLGLYRVEEPYPGSREFKRSESGPFADRRKSDRMLS